MGDTDIRPPHPLSRVEQFFTTLTHRHNREVDDRLRALLGDDQLWQLVERLPAFDRAHHLRVHDRLVAWGQTDPDLLRAALLHDIGKSNGHGRVCIWHRVARVSGRRLAPGLWRKLAAHESRLVLGLYLAEHHARLGAAILQSTGCSPRCCELVARHEDPRPTGDPMLDALIAADEDVSA